MLARRAFLLFIAAVAVALPVPSGQLEFRFISFNVRTDTMRRFHKEHRWRDRREELICQLNDNVHDLPTVIGFQELKYNQLEDLHRGLNKYPGSGDWKYFGVGRDDGHEKGEYAPIFYQESKWQLVNGTTRWLSKTPTVPSKFLGAANKRIVTIVTFKNKETGTYINVLNTHYDHKSQTARGYASAQIVQYIKEIPNSYQTFLSGDFNSIHRDLSYKILTKDLADSREVALNHETLQDTYTGFEPDSNRNVIDFIWCPQNVNKEGSKLFVNNYNVLDTWTKEGYRISDHRPVVVDFQIEPQKSHS